jgi:hypothetical protein
VIDSTRSRPQLLRDPERVFLTIESLMYAGRVHCPVLFLHGGSDITVSIRSAEKIANAIRSSGNSGVTVRIIRRQPLVAAEPFRSESQLGLSACFRNFATTAGRDDQLGRNALVDSSKDMRR